MEPWREAFALLDAYKPSKTNPRLAYALRFHNLEARRRCTEVAYGGWRTPEQKAAAAAKAAQRIGGASGGDDPRSA
jgi:hypothetical protein